MATYGMKAIDLAFELLRLVETHGAGVEVFTGGTDYPEGVSGVQIATKGDGYIPAGVAVIF